MFEVGEKVISKVSNSIPNSQQREKFKVYTVHKVSRCEGCNRQKISLGQYGNKGEIGCSSCGWLRDCEGLYWTDAKYFMKFDKEVIQRLINSCIETEEYELAVYLRDQVAELELA